jgi:hypothetical protein
MREDDAADRYDQQPSKQKRIAQRARHSRSKA